MAVFSLEPEKKQITPPSKIVGCFLIVISFCMLFGLISNFLLFLKTFLLGVFGFFAFPLFFVLLFVGFALVARKKHILSKKYIIFLSCAVVSFLAIVQTALFWNNNFSAIDFLVESYSSGFTAGGFVVSAIITPFNLFLNDATILVVFLTSFIIFSALVADFVHNSKNIVLKKQPTTVLMAEKKPQQKKPPKPKPEKIELTLNAEQLLQKKRDNAAKILGIGKFAQEQTNVLPPIFERVRKQEKRKMDVSKQTLNGGFTLEKFSKPSSANSPSQMPDFEALKSWQSDELHQKGGFSKSEQSDDQSVLEVLPPTNVKTVRNNNNAEKENVKKKRSSGLAGKNRAYLPPHLDLITTRSTKPVFGAEQITIKSAKLENVLEQFKVPAKVINVVVGPTITRYELEMPVGISVKKLLSHADDIALTLASNGAIRIEAPIPGKSAVGIEVPNEKVAMVSIRDVLESSAFINNKSPLTCALGKDIAGNPILCNIANMPHLLIAGATKSGKSVCLNTILTSLIFHSSPDDLRMILIDPKFVEFSVFAGIPHLMVPSIISDPQQAVNALSWAIDEMERRYQLLREQKVRNIDEFNLCDSVVCGEIKKLPFILIVLDEFGDLMITKKKEVEERITRLAQKARAAGIHLILATQRPSVDVITGTIKANMTSRIAFQVSSFQDSRTILDQSGAEKLLGQGDMLFAPSDRQDPIRVQGCFVSTREVDDVVSFVIENNSSHFDDEALEKIEKTTKLVDSNGVEFDELMAKAVKTVIANNSATINILQRKLEIGFPRASRIIDQMQESNFILPAEGGKPKTINITKEEFEEIFGEKYED